MMENLFKGRSAQKEKPIEQPEPNKEEQRPRLYVKPYLKWSSEAQRWIATQPPDLPQSIAQEVGFFTSQEFFDAMDMAKEINRLDRQLKCSNTLALVRAKHPMRSSNS